MTIMPDFWRHSGFHLMTRAPSGECLVSEDLLRAYFARPEVAPTVESCATERALFARIQSDPRCEVAAHELAAITDPDVRDNYAVLLRWRAHLLQTGTVEDAYRRLFAGEDGRPVEFAALGVPPLFVDQLAQMILRSALDGASDPFVVRAAEMFFREQVASVEGGQIVLADRETVEGRRDRSGSDSLLDLVAHVASMPVADGLDVMNDDNASSYWERDERHDFALHLNFGRRGLGALCEVIALWVRHMHGIALHPVPIRSIDGARLAWFTGLDAEATVLLNDLYNSRPPGDSASASLLCLLEATLPEDSRVWRRARGERCHFALCMNRQGRVRIKPQNLLLNLPIGQCA